MRTAISTEPSVKYQNLMQCVWIHLGENDEIPMASLLVALALLLNFKRMSMYLCTHDSTWCWCHSNKTKPLIPEFGPYPELIKINDILSTKFNSSDHSSQLADWCTTEAAVTLLCPLFDLQHSLMFMLHNWRYWDQPHHAHCPQHKHKDYWKSSAEKKISSPV